jgi:hypothetical protein
VTQARHANGQLHAQYVRRHFRDFGAGNFLFLAMRHAFNPLWT